MGKSIHVSIPEEVYDAIAELTVRDGRYRSVPEFILETIRIRLYEMRQQKVEKKKIYIPSREQKQTGEQASSHGLNLALISCNHLILNGRPTRSC
jgi:Arc/MetJ-type ribon-helix-helix transcriptional regulator